MATANEQRSMIEAKLAVIRSEIATLQAQERVLAEILSEMKGEVIVAARKRSPSIKPLVIDFMRQAGERGATSREVDEAIRLQVPSVATDTVGSVLSRLKSDGALAHDGERYYEKKFAPMPRPFDNGLRAVN